MTPQDTSLSADIIVLDVSVIVNMLKPGVSQTFKEYAHDVFSPYVKSHLDKAKRVYIVWDDYRQNSLKNQTREKSGKGVRR